MRISVSLERFKKGLGAMEKIVASKSTLPVLNNILIKADGNQVVLSATDLEMGVNYYLGGKIDEPGSITVPGKVLSNFVNGLNEETVILEVKDNILHTKTGKSEASINGISADEFPTIPKVEGKNILEINGRLLKTAISQVGFAASFDESRPILTGVFFSTTKETLKLVATDSYRLAEKIIKIPSQEEVDFIVPIKTIQELYRVIGGSEEIKIVLSDNQVMFVLPDMELTSRIIEGEYPDYEQIIPKSFKTKAIVSIHELMNAVRTASFFTRESANNVKISFKKSVIDIEAASSQLGNFKSQIPNTLNGEEGEINFNAKYLLDALGGIETEEARIELVGKLSPGMIKPEGKESNITYIIMPLRN